MYVCVSINVIIMQHTVYDMYNIYYYIKYVDVIEPIKVCQFSTSTSDLIITTTVDVTNEQVDNAMMTALMVAAYKGHVEVVQMLLQSGKVHVDQKDSKVSMLFIIHLPILFMYRIIINECVYSVYLYCSSIL